MAERLARVLAALADRQRHDPRDELTRLAARLRARDCCEYCLMPTSGQFQIDHIIPPKLWAHYVADGITGVVPHVGRRGPDHLDNYAWCCTYCNGRKGQRLADRVGRARQQLFDPRYDRWSEHFILVHRALFIVGLTGIGRATERTLGLNAPVLGGPLAMRHLAILDGRYPPLWAREWQDDGE